MELGRLTISLAISLATAACSFADGEAPREPFDRVRRTSRSRMIGALELGRRAYGDR
jgi:hypothetical protein